MEERDDDLDDGADRHTTITVLTAPGAVSARREPVNGRTLFV